VDFRRRFGGQGAPVTMSTASAIDVPTERSRAAPRLALVELLDADGRVQQAWDVLRWPLRLGRALDNDVVLHDAHASAHHASLDVDVQDRVILTAATSRNGVRIEEGRSTLTLSAGQQAALAPLALWHIGTSTLRVRRLNDPLPDERVLAPAAAPASRWVTALLLALAALWTGASLWLENNPDATWERYLPEVAALGGAAALWSGLWGLASKLFNRRFVVMPHLRVLLAYALAIGASQLALSLLAYAADWAWASRVREIVTWALAAAMVAHHLRLVLPARARRINLALGSAWVLAIASSMALNWQRTERFFDELYATTLPPPSWRVAPAQPADVLIDELRTLEAPLLESARKAAAKEGELAEPPAAPASTPRP
jgi:hypothetical protein